MGEGGREGELGFPSCVGGEGLVDSFLGKECVGALDVRVYKFVPNVDQIGDMELKGEGKERENP